MADIWPHYYTIHNPVSSSSTITPMVWTSNNTIQISQTWPTPVVVPEPKKGDPDPLDWLRERVEEICELSGIAA